MKFLYKQQFIFSSAFHDIIDESMLPVKIFSDVVHTVVIKAEWHDKLVIKFPLRLWINIEFDEWNPETKNAFLYKAKQFELYGKMLKLNEYFLMLFNVHKWSHL